MPGITRAFRAMTRGGLLAAAGLTCLLGAPSTAMAGTAIYPEVEALERFGYTSRHAYLNHRVTVRAAPNWFARHVTRLETRTEDRTDELVSILARSKDRNGLWWLKVRLPIRPNGSTGWVPRTALGEIRRVDGWLKVDQRRFRLQLLRRGRVVFQARVGVGQERWPTPNGTFYVRNRLAGAALGSMYGPLAFGTSARSAVLTDWPGGGVIGIHGTDRPGLLPGRVSHGCIRLRNADVMRLGRLLAIGTPVTIT